MSLSPDDLRPLLALQLVPGLGPARTRALIEHLGSARAVLTASRGRLAEVPGIGEKLSADIAAALPTVDVDGELALIHEHGVRVLASDDGDYPASVKEIFDPPP